MGKEVYVELPADDLDELRTLRANLPCDESGATLCPEVRDSLTAELQQKLTETAPVGV